MLCAPTTRQGFARYGSTGKQSGLLGLLKGATIQESSLQIAVLDHHPLAVTPAPQAAKESKSSVRDVGVLVAIAAPVGIQFGLIVARSFRRRFSFLSSLFHTTLFLSILHWLPPFLPCTLVCPGQHAIFCFLPSSAHKETAMNEKLLSGMWAVYKTRLLVSS